MIVSLMIITFYPFVQNVPSIFPHISSFNLNIFLILPHIPFKFHAKVPVGYCSPKHIRRITGGSPGMVSILQQTGVVYGCPDQGKLWVEKYGPQVVDNY